MERRYIHRLKYYQDGYQFSTWSTDIRELLKFQWPFAEREVTLKKQRLGLVTLASTPSCEQGLCREGKRPGASHCVTTKIQAGVRLSRKIPSLKKKKVKGPMSQSLGQSSRVALRSATQTSTQPQPTT